MTREGCDENRSVVGNWAGPGPFAAALPWWRRRCNEIVSRRPSSAGSRRRLSSPPGRASQRASKLRAPGGAALGVFARQGFAKPACIRRLTGHSRRSATPCPQRRAKRLGRSLLFGGRPDWATWSCGCRSAANSCAVPVERPGFQAIVLDRPQSSWASFLCAGASSCPILTRAWYDQAKCAAAPEIDFANRVIGCLSSLVRSARLIGRQLARAQGGHLSTREPIRWI